MKEPSARSGELIKEVFKRRKEEQADHSHTITFSFKATWSINVENGKSQMTADTARQLVTDPEGGKKLLEIEQWSNQSSLEELHASYAEAFQKQMADALANGLAEFVEVETVA